MKARLLFPRQFTVRFRMWRLDDEERLIVLFPKMNYETGDCHAGGCCLSYMHNGQHSEADYHFIMRHSRPATKAEYAELKKELETIYGYKLTCFCQ